MNTITIELCQEDRARLDAILAALTDGHNCEKCVKDVAQYAAAVAADAAQEKAEEPTQAETPAEENAPTEAPAVKLADIQRKVVELSGAGKKAEIRSIVKDYADRVSGIPGDKLAEVWDRLTALEG